MLPFHLNKRFILSILVPSLQSSVMASTNSEIPIFPSKRDRNERDRPSFSGPILNQGVFYSREYHPIQAGSIDGTDTVPHDRAVKRALVTYQAGLYNPNNDRKMVGDPNLTLFISRLSPSTTEEDLRAVLGKFGHIRNIRLVRDVVTGTSRRYAFVEYEKYRDMWRAFREANNIVIHDAAMLVEWNRQRLMPHWIPRRFGGGLGGTKTSGQLRFGGRARPFRAPLKEVPYEELRRLRIPVPENGDYTPHRAYPPLPPSMVRGIELEVREEEEKEMEREEEKRLERRRRKRESETSERSERRSRERDERPRRTEHASRKSRRQTEEKVERGSRGEKRR